MSSIFIVSHYYYSYYWMCSLVFLFSALAKVSPVLSRCIDKIAHNFCLTTVHFSEVVATSISVQVYPLSVCLSTFDCLRLFFSSVGASKSANVNANAQLTIDLQQQQFQWAIERTLRCALWHICILLRLRIHSSQTPGKGSSFLPTDRLTSTTDHNYHHHHHHRRSIDLMGKLGEHTQSAELSDNDLTLSLSPFPLLNCSSTVQSIVWLFNCRLIHILPALP